MSAEGREARGEGPAKFAPTTNPLLVLLSAPSGGGKTTLCQQLLAASGRAPHLAATIVS